MAWCTLKISLMISAQLSTQTIPAGDGAGAAGADAASASGAAQQQASTASTNGIPAAERCGSRQRKAMLPAAAAG